MLKSLRIFSAGIALALVLVSCTNASFETATNPGGGSVGASGFGDDGTGNLTQPGERFGPPDPSKGIFEFATAVNKDNIWVVTNVPSGMAVYLITMQNGVATVAKTWFANGTPTTGARTFVSEAGLLIGKQGGSLYLVTENTPTGTALTPVWTPPSAPAADTRLCMTSYNVNNSSYVGVAWESANNERMFSRFPLNNGTVSFNSPVNYNFGNSPSLGQTHWTCRCFTDQSRKYFWGAWNANTAVFGLNLASMTPMTPASAPNANHANTGLGTMFNTPANGQNPSYALSGSAFGDIISGQNMYTFTHETRNNVIFGTRTDTARLILTKAECVSTDSNCTTKVKQLDTLDIGQLKPLSSFNDGRVIGLVRGAPSTQSQIYLLELNNPLDIMQGVRATRLAAVNGDSYMYQDFTGYSLPSRDFELIVQLDALPNFKANTPIKTLSFSWLAQAGGTAVWQGLTLEARCFQSGGSVPLFQSVSPIANAGMETRINVASCNNAVFNRVDIRVTGTGGTAFTRTSQIKVYGTQ